MCNHQCSYDDFNYYLEYIRKMKQAFKNNLLNCSDYDTLIIETQIKTLDLILQNGEARLLAKEEIKLRNKKENRKLLKRRMYGCNSTGRTA